MNKTRNNSLRAWLTAFCAAAICLLGTQTAWGQTDTDRGVRVTKATGETTATKVTKVTVTTSTSTEDTNNPTAGQIITAKEGRKVTVVTDAPAAGKVAKVTVTSTTIPVVDITVTSADDVTEMNGNAQLQMSATIVPTYADGSVTWSVASATGSSATATIDASTGMLTAGTVQGDVIVTARATNGTEDVTDDVVNTKTITITTIPLTADMITVAAATYTGSPLTPTVTVKYGETTLTQDTDYTISSLSNNIYPGTASVTVTGMGAYIGSIVKNFTINKGNQNPTITRDDASHRLTISGYHGYVRWYNGDSEFVDYAGISFCIISSLSWQTFTNNHSIIRVECAGDDNWNPKTVVYTF